MEIIRNPKEYGFDGCDVVVKLPESRKGGPIKLLQLTDMQMIDSLQQRTPDRLRADEISAWLPDFFDENLGNHIKSLISQANTDLIFITGDMVYGSFDDNGTTFTWFCEFMNSLEIPWAPVFGNHDNESQMGVDWQCEQLEKGKYCLFKRGEVSGNGNYTVGIAVGDKLTRVMHLLDSHGCLAERGLRPDQLELVRVHTEKIRKACRKKIPAIIGFHHPTDEFRLAEEAKEYRTETRKNYIIGVDVVAKDGDFGTHQENFKPSFVVSVPGFLEFVKDCDIDGVFVGHFHSINTCITYENIKWVYGLKTGQYDYHNPGQLGGTLVTLDKGDLTVSHIPSLVNYAPFPGKSSIFEDFFLENSFIAE